MCHHVCTMCIAEGKSFEDAILPVFFKTNSSGVSVARSANANHHMNVKHKEYWDKVMKGKRKIPGKSSKGKTGKMVATAQKQKGSSQTYIYDSQIALVRMVLQNRLPLSICCSGPTNKFINGILGGLYTPLEENRRDRLLDIFFARMIMKITNCLQEARSYYRKNMEEGNLPCTFLSVTHSKWDVESNFYGVTLRWIDPSTFQLNHVALGLVHGCPESNNISDAMKNAGELLQKYGVAEEDVMATLTCAPIYYPESYDAGVKKMNIVQVLFFEALKSSEQLIDRARELIHSLSEPARWSEYVSRAAEYGRNVVRLTLENQDHLVGIHNMIKLLLCSYHCINDYFNKESEKASNLSQVQWQNLVQIEALMRPVVQLDMEFAESMPTGSMSWLHFKRALHMCTKDFVRVIVLDRNEWSADVTLDLMPTAKMTLANLDQDVSTMYHAFKQGLEENIPDPSERQLIAMLCDPIVMTAGRLVVQTDSKVWDDAQRWFNQVVVDEASSLSDSSLEIEKEVSHEEKGDSMLGANEVDDYMSQLRSAEAERAVVSVDVEGDNTADELGRWFSIKNVDWEEEFFAQNPQIGNKARRGQLFDRSRLDDAYYLYTKVDPLMWWDKKKKEFPIIHRVAAKYLALPVAHFGSHFTAAPFIDSYKPKHIGIRRFEQTVVQSFNSTWFANVDDRSDSALRNLISKGKPKNVEDYVRNIYSYYGEKIEENEQQIDMFTRDVEAFSKDLAIHLPHGGMNLPAKSPKRKKRKVKS
uniref:HAT C-terminal dimerisation domain-containing protein n=1 Tax=Aplanochytrium stocchinoi TaxID=215587 RepID=A0A6S8DAF3_9STRA